MEDKQFDYRVTLTLCLLALLATLPFGIYHLIVGDALMATVTLALDGVLALMAGYLYRTRRTDWFNAVVGVIGTAVVFTAVHEVGPAALYWVFPAILVYFYILPLKAASGASLLGIVGALALVYGELPPGHWVRLLAALVLVAVFAYVFSSHVRRQQRDLERLACIDPLSRAGNRRGMEAALAEAVHGKGRYSTRSSLIVLDIDHFKKINDVYGHAVGDQVIEQVAALVQRRIRRSDRLFRYGGEEFVLLASHTGLEQARTLAESLRLAVLAETFAGVGGLTISLGVAELLSGEDPQTWFRRADAALYRAKDGGRNRVEVAASVAASAVA